MAAPYPQLGLEDLRREEEAGLGLSSASTAQGLPVDQTLGLKTPGGPVSAPPAAPPEQVSSGGVEPTFENVLGPGSSATFGAGEGDLRYSDYAAAGGVEGIQESQRADSAVTGALLDTTDALLGKTTGTQRAQPEPEEMSAWQKGLLFIADIAAVAKGSAPPSAQLDFQRWRALTVADHANRAAYTEGLQNINRITEAIATAPREQRAAIAASQAEMLERFGPGLGSVAKVIAEQPTFAENFHTFTKNYREFMEGTDADRVMYAITMTAATNPERAGEMFAAAMKENVFGKEVEHAAPAIVKARMPEQINAGRRQGGEQAQFANRLASGVPITAAEYAVYNENLPENAKVPDSVVEAMQATPDAFLPSMPGLKTPELEKLRKQKEIEGLYSSPTAFVNAEDPTKWKGAPSQSAEARRLMSEGYVPAGFSLQSQSVLGEGKDVFGRPSATEISRIQEKIRASTDTLNRLYDIRNNFQSDFLTYQGRLKNFMLKTKSAVGFEGSEEDQQWKAQRDTLYVQATELLNEMLHALSGAAVTEAEFQRLASVMPQFVGGPGREPMDPSTFVNTLNAQIDLLTFYKLKLGVWEDQGATVSNAYKLSNREVLEHLTNQGAALVEAIKAEPQNRNLTDEQISEKATQMMATRYGVEAQDYINAVATRGVIPVSGGAPTQP